MFYVSIRWEVEQGPYHVYIYSELTKHSKVLLHVITAIVLISGHVCWINQTTTRMMGE